MAPTRLIFHARKQYIVHNDSYETFIERIKTQITDYSSNKVDLIQEEKRQEAMLTKSLQTKASMQGPITKKIEESKKEIKIKE